MTSKPTDTIYVGGSTQSNTQQEPFSNQQSNTTTEDQNSNLSTSQPPQHAFYPILDVGFEAQKGNFLPAIHCLRHNLMPKDYLDNTGYSFLHYAVSQNSIPLTILFLDQFKMDVDLLSKSHQTPLMIACHFGLVEIFRILCERGAQINIADETKFSPLFFAVKNGCVPQIAYLLHQKADPQARDMNGCTIVHWAAFRNNVFLLQLFKRLGLDFNVRDLQGFSPHQRAIQGEAHKTVDFLLENGENKTPVDLKLDQIHSEDLKNSLRRKFFPSQYEMFQDKCVAYFLKNSRKLTFVACANLWFFMMIDFFQVTASQGHSLFTIFFFLFSLLSLYYYYWYYLKSHSSGKKTHGYEKLPTTGTNMDTSFDTEPAAERKTVKTRLTSEALDKLVKNGTKETVIHDVEKEEAQSFLHELAWNFETKNYREIYRFNEKDYCAKCLKKKPIRSAHPKESSVCVPNFHHYSYCLGKSIDSSNHYQYLLLLIQQAILFAGFFLGIWSATNNQVQNKLFWFIESGCVVFLSYGGLYGVIYFLLGVLAVYNFFFLWLELYGVMRGLTNHEIFYRNDCPYLFYIKEDRRGDRIKYFANPYDFGIKNNIKYYIKRIFR